MIRMWNRFSSVLVLGFALCASSSGQAAGFERYYVIKLYDFNREFQYQVVSKDELKKLETEIKAEAKLFRKAVDAAKKEWREDESLSGSFPSSAVALRKLQTKGTPYKDRGAADDRIAALEDRDFRSAERRAERDEEREKTRYQGTQGRERRARAKKREERKEEKEETAREIFSRMFDDVKNPQGDDAEEQEPDEE